MIRLDRLYENFNSEYGTSQTGFFRPQSDFVPALIEISHDLRNRLVGVEPRSQKIQDWLSPFRRSMNIAIESKPSMDFAPYPDDYQNFDNAGIIVEKEKICGLPECDLFKNGECIPAEELKEDFFPTTTEYEEIPITLVPGNKWRARFSHPSYRPSMKKPAMKQVSIRENDKERGGFEVAPKGIGVIALHYFRSPVDPVFNYDTLVSAPDEYLQFKEAGSVHLEWSETLIPVFLYHLGKRYGLTMQEPLILQVRQLDKIFE